MEILTEGEGLSHGADDREVVWELLCRKRKTRLVASRWGVTHKGEAPSSLSLPPCPLILCSSTRPATQHLSVEHLPCHVSRYLPSSLSLSLTPPSSLSPCNYRSRLPSSDRIPPLPRISTSVWPHPASAPRLYICLAASHLCPASLHLYTCLFIHSLLQAATEQKLSEPAAWVRGPVSRLSLSTIATWAAPLPFHTTCARPPTSLPLMPSGPASA